MNAFDNTKAYFFYLLAKKDYSTQELADKALKKGYHGNEIKIAIQELTDLKYINDKRYCEDLVEHYNGTKGNTWIRQKLRQKKFSETLVQETLSNNISSPNNELKRKVTNKYSVEDWSNIEIKTKQKILIFIARQGFSNPYDILNKWAAKK